MQIPIRRGFSSTITLATAAALALANPACSTVSPANRSALLVGAGTLAQIAGTAISTYYGGTGTGKLASAGLSALGSVLQGYVGTTVPAAVVQSTPGVGNLGAVVAPVVTSDHPVTQADVSTVNEAARLVAASDPASGK